jgi:sec-independent protein translocase protein TatB
MFDLGWSELLLIAAVALIVIGPKDLPQAIRTVTQVIRKLRGMARDFQSGLDDLAREAGVDEIKRDLTDFKQEYDPRAALESIADADGSVAGAFADVDGTSSGNRIAPPGADERPDPPDLTPADFGAVEPPPAEPPPDEAAGTGTAATEAPAAKPADRKDGGTA